MSDKSIAEIKEKIAKLLQDSPMNNAAIDAVEEQLHGLSVAQIIEKFSNMQIKIDAEGREKGARACIKDNKIKFVSEPETEARLQKILQPVFDLFDNHTMKIKIQDADFANAANVAGLYMVFTKPFLELVTDPEELMAIAAHELGHDVFRLMGATANRNGIPLMASLNELMCDGIAAQALLELGVDPHKGALAMSREPEPKNEETQVLAQLASLIGAEDHPDKIVRMKLFQDYSKKFKESKKGA